jgi:lycopene beta-cyclase
VDAYETVRREKGVLPITMGHDYSNIDVSFPKVDFGQIGIRGGFYHAVTGYSFPMALKFADSFSYFISVFRRGEEDVTDAAGAAFIVAAKREEHWENERFLRLLNRMLFRAAKPEERYSVLQRFYGLNQSLIERFYAGTLTWRDKARILIGKPPVPVSKALYNFSERAFIKRERKRRESSE